MEYTNEIIINAPIDRVVELFGNSDNMYKWMEGIVDHEHLEGTPGQEGAKMLMVFNMGGNQIEITETILAKDLPAVFDAKYESKFSTNIVQSGFEQVNETTTRQYSVTKIKPGNFMVRMMTWLSPNMFKKQSQKYMIDFKTFAESAING